MGEEWHGSLESQTPSRTPGFKSSICKQNVFCVIKLIHNAVFVYWIRYIKRSYISAERDDELKERDDFRKDRAKERQRDRNLSRAAPDKRSVLQVWGKSWPNRQTSRT